MNSRLGAKNIYSFDMATGDIQLVFEKIDVDAFTFRPISNTLIVVGPESSVQEIDIDSGDIIRDYNQNDSASKVILNSS